MAEQSLRQETHLALEQVENPDIVLVGSEPTGRVGTPHGSVQSPAARSCSRSAQIANRAAQAGPAALRPIGTSVTATP